MNKRTFVIFGCVFVSALVFDIATNAQSSRVTPITAKLRQLNYWIEPDGTRTLARESVGVYARSANGSEHTTYFPSPDPASQVRHSRLFDKARGIVYQVNHASHVASKPGCGFRLTAYINPFHQIGHWGATGLQRSRAVL